MKSSRLMFLCVPLLACGTSGGTAPSGSTSGNTSGAAGQGSGSSTTGSNPTSGASTSGTGPTSGTTSGAVASGTTSGASGSTSGTGSGSSSGATSGTSSGATTGTSSGATTGTGSGSATGASSGGSSGAVDIDAGLPPGAVNTVPAGYTGTPFTTNVIPGFLYAANYDKGGAGIAYCHSATATTPATCANGIDLADWCCSDTNATMTGARCNDRDQSKGVCPLYRPDNDNAGLSHMNLGEVDTYAVTGPTWIMGPSGPTLTGPMVTDGTPVPQHANATTADDTYLSYTNSGEWQKYTVEVLAAGEYAIGALMGTPPNVTVTFDFGNGLTTGAIPLPASPVTAACKCAEAYHAWTPTAGFGMVTFPAAGTYLLTLTLNTGNYNPLYFTFTKM